LDFGVDGLLRPDAAGAKSTIRPELSGSSVAPIRNGYDSITSRSFRNKGDARISEVETDNQGANA
jgi:hypothetical protein